MNLQTFDIHNSHFEGTFSDLDPHLRRLQKQPMVYYFPLIDRLPEDQPGIYTIGGTRSLSIDHPTTVSDYVTLLTSMDAVFVQDALREAEACTAAHYKRYYPTYYIKSQGEVDIAYKKNDQFWPVEVK